MTLGASFAQASFGKIDQGAPTSVARVGRGGGRGGTEAPHPLGSNLLVIMEETKSSTAELCFRSAYLSRPDPAVELYPRAARLEQEEDLGQGVPAPPLACISPTPVCSSSVLPPSVLPLSPSSPRLSSSDLGTSDGTNSLLSSFWFYMVSSLLSSSLSRVLQGFPALALVWR